MTLSDTEVQHALVQRLKDESRKPENWYWMSFADESRFLGAIIIRARGPITANQLAWARNINPGGEALMLRLDSNLDVPDEWTNRLLNAEEANAIATTIKASRKPTRRSSKPKR